MLFASVVSATEAREGQAFFPLSVDYQEKFAAAGRIPGNFFRREAKLSDYEVLICRLVDRAIRPLFPDGYMNETQVIINLMSGDKEEMPDALAALAASAALCVSNIPWAGPISETRVARVNGEFKINPTREEAKASDLDIIVGATLDNVTMVEGEAKECSEKDLVAAIRVGHEAIKVQCQAQIEMMEALGKTVKRTYCHEVNDEELRTKVWEATFDKAFQVAASANSNKHERIEAFEAIC